ncbi:hypothetical protein DPMN_062081 [Dreissena polymorpha]|uniref:Uncharacterized protein n=1 Tax=Dreissena polymorpha TaxID=45954 RepID=A0A9D4C963_DREPO|nr:hypothetical protein DPMN_062081 [Dreissena polymorpha]
MICGFSCRLYPGPVLGDDVCRGHRKITLTTGVLTASNQENICKPCKVLEKHHTVTNMTVVLTISRGNVFELVLPGKRYIDDCNLHYIHLET